MQPVAPVLPGETLAGKYRVERVLGRGGMGIVVAARHLELDERVAIKFLLGEQRGAATDRFLREARTAAKIKGEHICRVFDFGRTDTGEPYIVMEHLEGTDLARLIEREGPQRLDASIGWIIESCDALAVAHGLGIVHRDLKPANIFLATRPDGTACAKVLDFGISKLAHDQTLTGPQATMGSPLYMSPEQIESAHDVDARSDVWSLGVVLYELLAGQPPFTGDSMIEVAVRVRETMPAPLRERAPEVPAAVEHAIAKCLAKDPSKRWANVAELVGALAPFAPPDVAALVARLRRPPSLAPVSPGLALEETATDDRQPKAVRGTFAPLQSTRKDGDRASSGPRTSRRHLPAAAAGAVVIAALAVALYAGRGLRASSAPSGPPAPNESATHVASDSAASAVVNEGIPSAPTAAAAARLALSSSSSSLPGSGPKIATRATPDAGPSAVTETPDAGRVEPSADPSAQKRRALDRDDP